MVEEAQHRITNRLTALHLVIDVLKREDQLPPKEARLIDEAHVAVKELTEALVAERPQAPDR
jgi:hypothetical protein